MGNSARICDVIVENSPLVMYIDVHKISFLLTVRRAVVLILSDMMQNICSHVILKEYSGWNIIFEENEKKVKLSVHNQWRVLHNDITNSGGVANLRMSIIRMAKTSKIHNSKTDYPILLKCSLLSLLGLLHSLKAYECLTFIPL